jgi:hypothetical protein
MFDMLNSIKEAERKNNLKIAVLSKGREDDRKHFVKLSRTIGHLNTEHFRQYDKAITWLLESKDIFEPS